VNDKQNRRPFLFWFVVATIFAAFLSGVWLYFNVWLPNRELANYSWSGLAPVNDDALSQRWREISHKVISYPFGNHHDAFLVLETQGNHESIPYLLRALSWQQMPDGNGTVVCTTEHCVDCLQKLTGKDFGCLHEDWVEWWQKEGVRLPVEELAKRAAAASPAEQK